MIIDNARLIRALQRKPLIDLTVKESPKPLTEYQGLALRAQRVGKRIRDGYFKGGANA